MREAYVPTQQPQAEEEARFPPPDAHRAAAAPCFGPAGPVAGSASRPDLARPRPCDLRGPRSGSRRHAGRLRCRSASSDDGSTGTAAGRLRDRATGRGPRSTATASAAAPRRARGARRRARARAAPTSSVRDAPVLTRRFAELDAAVRSTLWHAPESRDRDRAVPSTTPASRPSGPRSLARVLDAPDPRLAARERHLPSRAGSTRRARSTPSRR